MGRYFEMTIRSENKNDLDVIWDSVTHVENTFYSELDFEIDTIAERCEHGINLNLDPCDDKCTQTSEKDLQDQAFKLMIKRRNGEIEEEE